MCKDTWIFFFFNRAQVKGSKTNEKKKSEVHEKKTKEKETNGFRKGQKLK